MNKGFIALTITLSVGGMLIALVGSSAIASAIFFDMALRKEYRYMNYHYAYDCLDQAVLGLAHDYFFTTDTPLEIPHFHCSITTVSADGDLRHITARGDYQKAYVYRKATVRLNTHGLDVVKIE